MEATHARSLAGDIISSLFGLLFMAIGLVNTFWGNDPGFGLFIVLLSFLFYPPVRGLVRKSTGFAVPAWALVLLAIFILWASLGVGELSDKVDMMLSSFKVN